MEKLLFNKEKQIQQLEKENLELIHSLNAINEMNNLKIENEKLQTKIMDLEKEIQEKKNESTI